MSVVFLLHAYFVLLLVGSEWASHGYVSMVMALCSPPGVESGQLGWILVCLVCDGWVGL